MNFKKMIEIIKNTETRHRDYVIERILNSEEKQLTTNEKFISEVRDHLSTLINRSEFINKSRFREPEQFIVEKTCDCKVELQSSEDFDKNIQTIYLMYRQDTNFNPLYILNEDYIKYLEE